MGVVILEMLKSKMCLTVCSSPRQIIFIADFFLSLGSIFHGPYIKFTNCKGYHGMYGAGGWLIKYHITRGERSSSVTSDVHVQTLLVQ